jgi:hypothetical protein
MVYLTGRTGSVVGDLTPEAKLSIYVTGLWMAGVDKAKSPGCISAAD